MAGTDGAFEPPVTIWLDPRADSTAKRCALAHELIHAERQVVAPARHPLMQREEAIVRAETARRLVPAGELEPWVAHRVEAGHQVTVGDVAAEWDVTPEVAREALSQLTRKRGSVDDGGYVVTS